MFAPPPSQTFCFLSVLGLANFPWLLAVPGNASPAQRPDIQLFQTGKAWSELLQPLPVAAVCPQGLSALSMDLKVTWPSSPHRQGVPIIFLSWVRIFDPRGFLFLLFFFHWGRRWGKLKGILPSLELGFWGWLFCLGMSMVRCLCWEKP